MEGLWKQHQPLGRAQQQQHQQQQQSYGAAAGQVNSAVSQLNHHPYVAHQEVCVIERTIRQETLGAANIINFGGLQGALKQHQAAGGNANNQLLALVQQQSRHSGTLGTPLNSSYPQHLQLNPSWSACGQPQELYPASTPRSVFNGVVNLPTSLERDIASLKNRTAPALPEALETALLRKTNVDFFKDNLSRSGFDTTQCSAEQQIQNLHAIQAASSQKKVFNSGSTMPGLPTSTFGPRVSTLGCQGLSISGELLLTSKIRLEVICSCHGCHMSVSKFVQHAGSHSLNPGNAVYLETGETLVQWRRNLFSQVGVKVPDDEVGWDWTEGNACETDRNRSLETFKADSYLNSQPSQMAMLPTSMSYGIYQDTVLQGLSRHFKGNIPEDVARDQPSQIQSFHENAMKFQKVVSKGPIDYPNTSTSEYIDFISPGGRAYSSPAEQQLGIRDKLGHSDQARKIWDAGHDNVRQEKDNISSSFELRLGQPSQQGHKGTSFGAFQSQFQTAIVQPNALMYGRAFQRTLDANLEPTNNYGFQGLPAQANAHQFSQERLEKINVVNNQFGATGMERSVLGERTKLWEEAGMSQNAGNRVSSDQTFITSGQLGSQTPDSSLELLSVSQAKQRMTNNRLLHDVVGFSSQIGSTLPTAGQQYLSQEFSQSTWTQKSSTTGKMPSETATLPSQAKEVMHCFDGARTSETILACRMSSASVATFVQQHQAQQLQQEGVTGHSLDGNGAPQRTKDIVSQQNAVDEQKTVTTSSTSPGDPSNALVEKEKHSDLTREASPILASTREDKALNSEDNRRLNDAENTNLHDLERTGLLDDNLEHHRADTSNSIMPASSGILVSVGENDLPLTRGHPEKHLAGQSSGWKTPAKSFPMVAVDGGENSAEAREAGDKSTSVDGEDETSSKKELQSDVSTKSSENVLSGFSDARHRNEETSTLESGSPKHDAVDEGSGIGKCSSEEQVSPDKKFDSTVSGQERNESPASSSRRGASSTEVNDSVMVEGLQATTQQCRTNDENRRKKAMKWKRLNAAFSNVPAEASKGTDSGLSGSPSDQQKREAERTDHKLTPKQKRSSRTSGRNQSAEHPVESIRGKQNHTLLKIRVPQLRERPHRSRKEEHADLVQEPSEEAKVSTEGVRRPTVRGSSKMMSLNSIMKLPAEQVRHTGDKASNLKKAEVGPKDDPGTSRKETRKRKLSDFDTAAVPQCHPEAKGKPLRVGPGVVPRGERSPRIVPKKVRCPDEKQLDKATNDVPKQTSLVPKRRRDAGPAPRRSADNEMAAKQRNDLRHQTASTTHSSIDEPTREPKETKWKSLKDSFDPLSRKPFKRAKVQPATCSVCGSSQSESHNQLIHCSCCPVKVHQACYGVPKVPKVAWACRPCKSKSDNAVCVLCGYGGGAMTRAQNARAAVKSLLRVWNAVSSADGSGKVASKQLRRSVRTSFKQGEDRTAESNAGQVSNSVTASSNDPTATQWIHMVCALWMPGTRCLNLGTMGMFDVSGVSIARRRMTCSICKRQGGSCIQCHEPKCAIPFHAWCAHTKGLLQIETVNDTSGHVRFHGKCTQHAPGSDLQQVNLDIAKRGTSASKCARTEGYIAKQRTASPAPEARKNTMRRLHPKKLE